MINNAFSDVFFNVGYSLLIFKRDEDFENTFSFFDEQRRKKFRRRRRKLVFLVLLLILAIIIGTFVMLGPYRRYKFVQGFEEFSCKDEDSACLSLECPQGMVWSKESEECDLPESHKCCRNSQSIIMCLNYEDEQDKDEECIEILRLGWVAPFSRVFCKPGFIWVPWKRKCFRSTG